MRQTSGRPLGLAESADALTGKFDRAEMLIPSCPETFRVRAPCRGNYIRTKQLAANLPKEAMKSTGWKEVDGTRRSFIGGSDARIIMGNDENSLLRLWQEKRGEVRRACHQGQKNYLFAGSDSGEVRAAKM
jgi:hypothetical protein